ncbi:MAG: response regulator [bacterium]|nr:response regulator [bacterium]
MFEDKVILIVDDDPSLLEMYVERIKVEGAIVLEAIDGEAAVRSAKDNHPAAILLDIMMPKLNGFEVLKNLKSDAETAKIPVIILTALADDQKKRQGLALGAADFIVKSETLPADVVEKLRKLIAPETADGKI